MTLDSESPLDPGVAAFITRLTTRDNPPQEPLRFDRTSVEQRIADGLRVRFPRHHQTMYPFLARLLYGFFQKPAWSTYELAQEYDRDESSLRRSLRPLLLEGLLERTTSTLNSHYKFFRLTRAGEDWLQTLVQAPLPEPVPSANQPASPDGPAPSPPN